MYTQLKESKDASKQEIKQKDLNTPLLQRVENFLALQKKQNQSHGAETGACNASSADSNDPCHKDNLSDLPETLVKDPLSTEDVKPYETKSDCDLNSNEPKISLFTKKGDGSCEISSKNKVVGRPKKTRSGLPSRKGKDNKDMTGAEKSASENICSNVGRGTREATPEPGNANKLKVENATLLDSVAKSNSDVMNSCCNDSDRTSNRCEQKDTSIVMAMSSAASVDLNRGDSDKLNKNVVASLKGCDKKTGSEIQNNPVKDSTDNRDNEDTSKSILSSAEENQTSEKKNCGEKHTKTLHSTGDVQVETQKESLEGQELAGTKIGDTKCLSGAGETPELSTPPTSKEINITEDVKTPVCKADANEGGHQKRKVVKTLRRRCLAVKPRKDDTDVGKEVETSKSSELSDVPVVETVQQVQEKCTTDMGSDSLDSAVDEMLKGIPETELQDIHVQFEDETKLSDAKGRGKEQTEVDKEIASMEADEEIEADIVVRRAKQRKRKRRSADFEVLNTEIKMSPDICVEGLENMQGKAMPGTRRSKRLKRKSIELCRRSTPVLIETSNRESPIIQTAEESENADRERDTAVLPNINTNNANLETPKTPCSITARNEANSIIEILDNPTDISSSEMNDGGEDGIGKNRPGTSECPTTPECSAEQSMTTPDENSTRRLRRKRANSSTSSQSDTATTPSPSHTPRATTAKTKKKKNEPAIEDIYLNKLWRTQMPVDKTWETIHEEPKTSKSGKEEFFGGKRFKRCLDYDDFYTQQKLKRRRRKALKMGYKVLSKARLQKAEERLMQKMALLEREIEAEKESVEKAEEPVATASRSSLESCCIYGLSDDTKSTSPGLKTAEQKQPNSCGVLDSAAVPPAVPSTSTEDTETYYTPMKQPVDCEDFRTPMSVSEAGDSETVQKEVSDPNAKHWDELFSKKSVKKRVEKPTKKSSSKDGKAVHINLFNELEGANYSNKDSKSKRNSLSSIAEETEIVEKPVENSTSGIKICTTLQRNIYDPSTMFGASTKSNDRLSLASIKEEDEDELSDKRDSLSPVH